MGAGLGATPNDGGSACGTVDAFLGSVGIFVLWGRGLAAGANPEIRNFSSQDILSFTNKLPILFNFLRLPLIGDL